MTTDAALHRAVLMQRIGVLEVENRDLRQELAEVTHERDLMKNERDDWRAKSVEGTKR